MKISHVLALSLLTFTIAQPLQSASSGEGDFKVLFHLFNPFPQHFAQERIHAIAVRAHEKQSDVGNYQVAFMRELRGFLLEEIKAAFTTAAQSQNQEADSALYLAEEFLRTKFEEPYRAKKGINIFDADPFELDEHCFTYCIREYLSAVLLAHPRAVPSQSRLGTADVYGYLHMILIGIDYGRQGMDWAEKIILATGVTRLRAF